MDVKKFRVSAFNEGISLIKKHYGEEGILIASKRVGNEWEIIAAANETEAQKYFAKQKNQALFETKKPMSSVITTSTPMSDSLPSETKPDKLASYKPSPKISSIEDEFSEQDSFIAQFKDEIDHIKAYLQSQHANAVWKDFKYSNDLNLLVLKKMYQSGFSIPFSQAILDQNPLEGNLSIALRAISKNLKQQLQFEENPFSKPGIYCLMGVPGCGKSSMILKIAMAIRKNQKKAGIHLINGDFESLSQVEQLNRIGHLLDIHVHHLDGNIQQLTNVLFTEEDYIFIDIPNQPALIQVIQAMNEAEFFKTPICYYLVIDNNWELNFIYQMIAQHQNLKDLKLIFTKCDMQARYATMMEASITSGRPIALLSYSGIDLHGLKKPTTEMTTLVFDKKESNGKELTDLQMYTMMGYKES